MSGAAQAIFAKRCASLSQKKIHTAVQQICKTKKNESLT